ncbi:MAG: hypothetical protein IJ649_03020 [Oscillospiraceae bacterium]|nr:hypothetical protein [Oscillospiraceae bacterium]
MMYRAEIIANQSVQDDIVETLEEYIPDILYTIVPLVHGRGGDDRKLGSTTWPETNFAMFSYVEDKYKPVVDAVLKMLKMKFKGEGIKLFWVKAEA